MTERLTANRGRLPSERQPAERANPPGRGPMVAVIVLTGVVLLFAAAITFWMYWLQGSLPS